MERYVEHIPKNAENYRELWIGGNNKAVHDLFGVEEGFSQDAKNIVNFVYDNIGSSHRGKVIISEIFTDKVDNSKIFNHVAIDRFTGGAMGGALFSEKVSKLKEDIITINIYLEEHEFGEHVIESFEKAIEDICKGLLPLGGMTTKGNGMFTGELIKNGESIYKYK